MTFWIVATISWACPGGWLSGLVPEALRPLVCKQQAQTEVFDRLSRARDRVRDAGPTSRLTACRGLRCKDASVIWTTSPEFK